MTFWRNIFAVFLILALLAGGLWLLFSWNRQVEERLREFLGKDVCAVFGDRHFPSFAQEGLDTLVAREVVIPADPQGEWRELAVLSSVTIRTEVPFVPALDSQQLAVSCAVGEINVEETAEGWNYLVPGRKLLGLFRDRRLVGFSCEVARRLQAGDTGQGGRRPAGGNILRLQVRRDPTETPWLFQLKDARVSSETGELVTFTARVQHESWAGGTIDVDLVPQPWNLTVQVEGSAFSGTRELLDLLVGHLQGVRIEGTGDLSLSGTSDSGGMTWEGRLEASDLRVTFTQSRLALRDLVGVLHLQNGKVWWDSLTGTAEGFEVTTKGELSVEPPGGGQARIDFPSLALSAAWQGLFSSEELAAFVRKTPPGGVMRGTVQVVNVLSPQSQELWGSFSTGEGGELSFGQALRLKVVHVEGKVGKGSLREGAMTWSSLTLYDVDLGSGTCTISERKDRWIVTHLSLSAGETRIEGNGEFTAGSDPALALTLKLTAFPLSHLFRLFGLPSGPEGVCTGDVSLRYDGSGTICQPQNKLSLDSVTFGSFLGKLSGAVEEDIDLTFTTGRASFRAANGQVALPVVVLVGQGRVLVLSGKLTPEGQASMGILILPRGKLVEDVLFSSTPDRWPVTEEEWQEAVCLELSGSVSGESYTSVPTEEFLETYFKEK